MVGIIVGPSTVDRTLFDRDSRAKKDLIDFKRECSSENCVVPPEING